MAGNKIVFSKDCSHDSTLTVAAVGDILLHYPLQKKASEKGYESLWLHAIPYFSKTDITFGNLEGSIANIPPNAPFDNAVYSRFPHFKYHPLLGQSLKKSGFTIVTTANNHTLDGSTIGIDKTIQTLNNAGIEHTGTRIKSSEASWEKIIEKKGFKLAWIGCTEHTNGIIDTHQQVLYCFKKADREWIVNKIEDLKTKVDAIIVTPHWGEEYQSKPSHAQREFAHQMLNAGASAIIGSHPHVLQPLEQFKTTDGRLTLISYSLGNFVSYQGSLANRSSIILLIHFSKVVNTTQISHVQFVPIYMQNRHGIENIALVPLSGNQKHFPAFQNIIMSAPEENAIFSPKEITPCQP